MADDRYDSIVTQRGTFGVRHRGASGPLVVCLHGFPDDASTFDALAAALALAGYRVAAVNLRGYAPSPLDGPLDLDSLVEDLFAVIDELSPNDPVFLVGHDYGAQISYPAMAHRPDRFAAASLFSGAHPALVQRNARRSLRQVWMSRYILFFQLGALADRRVARHDFAYVDRLWRRWSPGFAISPERRTHVKRTLAASMPAPVAMYRGGDFAIAEEAIAVPTRYVQGGADGCALPMLSHGQEALFSGPYTAEDWPDVGHYPHLEQPERTATSVLEWFARSAA